MAEHGTLLIVEDEPLILKLTASFLRRLGYEVITSESAESAMPELAAAPIDVCVVDVYLPGKRGPELIADIRREHPSVVCIAVSGEPDANMAVDCFNAGAAAYFPKPIAESPKLHQALRDAVAEARRRRAGVGQHRAAPAPTTRIVGMSWTLDELREQIADYADSSATIMIHGETGTGKYVVAEEIHALSKRPGQLVTLDCTQLKSGGDPNMLASMLFGHERGAFHGADRMREGLFEVAGAGTVLLDEIGELPREVQDRLLVVLESREFTRVGGNRPIKMQARVLTATHRDLEQMVRDNQFREDLFYRLSVMTVRVPALRDRPEDIPLLTYHFIKKYNEEDRRAVRTVAPDALECLMRYPWPGNVRELRNIIQAGVVRTRGETLTREVLPPTIREYRGRDDGPKGLPAQTDELFGLPYADAKDRVIEQFTTAYLRYCLGRAGGNVTRAADMAGVARPNFRRLMTRHAVEWTHDIDTQRR
jgi:two-component system response regulator HydG